MKPQKGNIYLSGDNLNSINLNSWREKLGIVMQENFFKNDTVAANIALGATLKKDEKLFIHIISHIIGSSICSICY